jgi:hypothetical protein
MVWDVSLPGYLTPSLRACGEQSIMAEIMLWHRATHFLRKAERDRQTEGEWGNTYPSKTGSSDLLNLTRT